MSMPPPSGITINAAPEREGGGGEGGLVSLWALLFVLVIVVLVL